MKIFFSFMYFFVVYPTFAQNREILKHNKFTSSTFKKYEIEVKKKWFDSVKINSASTVQFIDNRADKSKMGFVRMGDKLEYYNFTFPEETAQYINSKFLHILKTESDQSEKFLIVIRHMWINQTIAKATFGQALLTGSVGYVSFCYFKADYYRENSGTVQLAGQIDTIISIRKWIGNAADDLLKKTLITALNVCDSMPLIQGAKSYTTKQFHDSLNTQFNYPILKANEPQKGIYLTYEEFLNNNPLQAEFEIKRDKKETYITSTIDTSITNNAWGYSDGKNIYRHLNDNYYRMNPVQNTFELAGPRIIRNLFSPAGKVFDVALASFLQGLAGGGMAILYILTEEKLMKELVPYQLNIKEGTFY